MCVCVCGSYSIRIGQHTCTDVHIHAYTYVCIYSHVHTHCIPAYMYAYTHMYTRTHIRTYTFDTACFCIVDGSFCLEVPPRPECQAGTAGEGGKVEIEENSQYHRQGSQALLGIHLESEYVLPLSLGCSTQEQFISRGRQLCACLRMYVPDKVFKLETPHFKCLPHICYTTAQDLLHSLMSPCDLLL